MTGSRGGNLAAIVIADDSPGPSNSLTLYHDPCLSEDLQQESVQEDRLK